MFAREVDAAPQVVARTGATTAQERQIAPVPRSTKRFALVLGNDS